MDRFKKSWKNATNINEIFQFPIVCQIIEESLEKNQSAVTHYDLTNLDIVSTGTD